LEVESGTNWAPFFFVAAVIGKRCGIVRLRSPAHRKCHKHLGHFVQHGKRGFTLAMKLWRTYDHIFFIAVIWGKCILLRLNPVAGAVATYWLDGST
jgi:hypothetical protein